MQDAIAEAQRSGDVPLLLRVYSAYARAAVRRDATLASLAAAYPEVL